MKIRTGLGLAVAGALALSACGQPAATTAPVPGATPTTPAASAAAPANIRVWLNGTDTPQEARDYLKKTFEAQNAGSTLTIEEQQWTGLVDKLTTALSSDSQTPDVVEVGNTQAATFTTVGAFADVTADLAGWGGDDLLPGFVAAGSVDGKTFAVPYYAGSKAVFYRKDLFEKAGLTIPTTMAEFVDTAIKLKAANPDKTKNFSGFWLPGKDWRNAVAFIWDAGGDLATNTGGAWAGALSASGSQAGLATVQKLFTEASAAPKDGDEADTWTPFCEGQAGMISAPGWVRGLILSEENGCPDMEKNLGVFALPGSDGSSAPVLLGGSNIAVAAKSPNQELARKAVTIMLSTEYQTILAKAGLTPAKVSLASLLGDDESAKATIAAASNARLTPAAAGWASVEGAMILEDFMVNVAKGGDIAALAAEVDAKITDKLK